MKKKMLVVAGLTAFAGTAHAADSSVPTLSQVLGASDISVSGYYDVAYSNMNSTGQFSNGNNSHIFDTPIGATSTTKNYSAFNLHQFGLIVAKQPKEGFGGTVNITAGQDASALASSGLGSNTSSHVFDLTQAYVSYATGPLTVIGGKFATLAGAELITSPSNTNYTRAWMFGWGPYTHTGVRATYAASDMVTLSAGLNNGFDQVNSTTGGKTGEFSVAITPSDMFSLATTYYTGKGMMGGATGQGHYLDVLGTINATDKLNFVFDYANAKQAGVTGLPVAATSAKWNALALYANYKFNDTWRISYRHEGFDDKQGYRSGSVQKLKSNTVTVGYAATKSMELRGEVRQDKSDLATAFLRADGTTSSTQMTYAVEAIYQF